MNSNRVSNVFTGAPGINTLITGFAADDIHLRTQYWVEISISVSEGDFQNSFQIITWVIIFCRPVITYLYERIGEESIVISEVSLTTIRSKESGANRESQIHLQSVAGWERKTGFADRGGSHRLLCISMQTRARHGGLLSTRECSRYIVHDLAKPVDGNQFTRITSFTIMNATTIMPRRKNRRNSHARENPFLILFFWVKRD